MVERDIYVVAYNDRIGYVNAEASFTTYEEAEEFVNNHRNSVCLEIYPSTLYISDILSFSDL